MVAAARHLQERAHVPGSVVVPGTWTAFVELLEAKGDAPWPRFAFREGEIEIEMAPGIKHEAAAERLAQLLAVYFDVASIDLRGRGSTTLKRPEAAGAEPDKSYAFPDSEHPDLVIEVTVTSGGLDKLKTYAALGVPEVWFWSDREGLTVHVLDGAEHVAVSSSRLLPGLDLVLLAKYLDEPSDLQARKAYREALSVPIHPSSLTNDS